MRIQLSPVVVNSANVLFFFHGKLSVMNAVSTQTDGDHVQPKTYELFGLALAGACLGFLLPYWVPDVVGSVVGQALVIVETVGSVRLDHFVGVGFWLGTALVVLGFLRRRRRAFEEER